MYERILVATDDSKLSRKAVRSAIGLAASTQADLVALHVVPRYPMSFFDGAVAFDPKDIARTEQQWTEKGRALVESVAKEASKAGVRAKPVIAHADGVAEAIMAAARKHRCDLIVMASHGRRGLSRVLLGSETQQVLTHTTTPVLVLR